MANILKCLVIVAACVALNFAGIEVSRKLDSLLFLDLIGTAVASLIYGPIIGIVVGFLTNGIAEFWGGQEHYFLFALVQATSALVWGFAPRLLRGRAFTDFFNDNAQADTGKHVYDYTAIFWGLIWISLVSHLIASLSIAFLMVVDPALSCSALATSTGNPDKILCDIAKVIFAESTDNFDHAFWKLAVAKAAVGWPDHLIAFSFAVLMVTHFLPKHRYNMSRPFHAEGGTTKTVGAIASIALISVAAGTLWREWEDMDLSHTWPWVLYPVFALAILLLANRYKSWGIASTNDIYHRINPDLEPAFEDAMRLGMVFSVIIYFLLSGMCGADCIVFGRPGDETVNKVTGAVGVAFIIISFRYVSIIIARSSRPIRRLLADV